MKAEQNTGWNKLRKLGRMAAMALGVVVLVAPGRSLAEVRTWDGDGADAKASTPANWSDNVAPTNGDSVILDATSQKALTWDLNVELGSWTQIGYTGIVTVATVYGTNGFTNLVITGDCIISNGVWTQTANPNVTYEVNRLHATIGGNLIVGPNAAIDVTGLGYYNQKGPGGTTASGNSGGTHGGRGAGTYGSSIIGKNTYGSVTRPVNLGSSGTSARGGGAILLKVTGATRIDGTVTAKATDWLYYAGAGGSVWLTTGSLEGTGNINADGGNLTTGGNAPGAAGRVAVWLTDTEADFSAYAGVISAYGGVHLSSKADPKPAAGPGTVYLQTADDSSDQGTLIVDNNGKAPYSVWIYDCCAGLGDLETATYEFKSIVLTNNGILAVGANNTLIVTNTIIASEGNLCGLTLEGGTLIVPDSFVYSNYFINVRRVGDETDFSPAQSLTIGTNAMLFVDQPHTFACDVTVTPGTMISHSANLWYGNPYEMENEPDANLNRLLLTIQGNLTVQNGGSVDVSGKGYPGPEGPGRFSAYNVYGGSYGGRGGGVSIPGAAVCYGSITVPDNLGSGGSWVSLVGGGAAILTVSGALTNNGLIGADGTDTANYAAAGGTVRITAGTFAGSGVIRANGGSVTGNAPGGGGRIALTVTNAGAAFSFYTGSFQAFSGRKGSSALYGGAGTIYLRTAAQGVNEGTLVVDNDSLSNTRFTEIGENVTDAEVGHVLIRNEGLLLLTNQAVLTVSGVWSNTASFESSVNSDVEFTGFGVGSTSTVYGGTAFSGLICTNAGKTLRFAANTTNSIVGQGRLTLRGTVGNNLVLRSTVDDTVWKLNVGPLVEQKIEFADVKDSDASLGTDVTAMNSVSNGPNPNWRFISVGIGETNVWTGNSNMAWSLRQNWSLDRTPVITDFIRIPASRPRYPVVYGVARIMTGLDIEAGASLSMNGYDLTVTEPATIAGTLVCAGTETVTFQKAATLSGALTAAGTETFRFEDDLNFTGSAVEPARSTVVLAGGSAQSIDLDGLTFYRVRVENSAAAVSFTSGFEATELRCEAPSGTRSLNFAQGATVAVRDLVLLGGMGVTNITINSTSPGQQWKLAVSGYRSVRGVYVQDSDASGGLPIPALASENGGNNANWTFGVAPSIWLGTSGNNFHTAANWSPTGVPGAGTRVLVASANAMTITGAVTLLDLTVGGAAGSATVTANAPVTTVENMMVLSNGTLTLNRPSVASNDVVVLAGGTLTHSVNTVDEVNKLDVRVVGNMSVDVGAAVDVQGKGYDKTHGPGNTECGGSYGGRAWTTLSKSPGFCYGSILSPTNLGSGGKNTAGGGAVLLNVAGQTRIDGVVSADADSLNPGGYTGSGGSVWLVSGTLIGIGTIRSDGGSTSYQGSGAGGRIALTVTQSGAGFSAFTGIVRAYGADTGHGGTGGGAGTVYKQAASVRPGRGTVRLDTVNNTNPLGRYTDVPSFTNGVPGEANYATFIVTNMATLRLTNDFTVGDIWLTSTDARLDLNGKTLTVKTRKHKLGPGTVVGDEETIIWTGLPPGMMIILR